MDSSHLRPISPTKTTLRFWEGQAKKLQWITPWKKTLAGHFPDTTWFQGGFLNASVNCLDRHLSTPRADASALIWEAEDGTERTVTYRELSEDVNRCANVLRSFGVKKGDRVTLYMGLVPEAVVAMLACARIGAIHHVVFGGFGVQALAERIQDVQSVCVITCDGAFRRGQIIPLKKSVDLALKHCPSVRRVLVVRRVGARLRTTLRPRRDAWWHLEMRKAKTIAKPASMKSDAPLFILHTSGTTGKPKGIVHSTGGYLTGVTATFREVFSPTPKDIYWCTADIGWITGHSYMVYGPLAEGATVFLYEGALDWPKPNRVWELCAKHKITIFYTAPTAIRAFMAKDPEGPKASDLSSLRLLGSVGEPLNPEAWRWYHKQVGQGRCAIMDTWWQTETGMFILAPKAEKKQKPGCVSRSLFSLTVDVVDADGRRAKIDEPGSLVIREPWPALMQGVWRDRARALRTYWQTFPGLYFPQDRCKQDKDGDLWILGRADDMLIVSGHNLSNAEIESALTTHASVSEAAAVGLPDPISGQRIIAFVVSRATKKGMTKLEETLRQHVGTCLSHVAKPKRIYFVPDLPKTRSGKIMRRLLRQLLLRESLGDITTLANPDSLTRIQAAIEEQR